jgi:putative spermidine/putrescine transport system ATP-binding protein
VLGVEDAASSVEINHVSKAFGDVVAVHDVTLSIRRGEFLTLLGPSGCGKTTLLNLIAGFFEPDSGTIHIERRDVTAVPTHQRETGMVFQSYALFPHMNVFDNLAFGLRMRKLPKSEIRLAVEQGLEMVELTDMAKRRVRQLSGGQQQRVALARAIVIRPKVLLLDEPLSALDKNLRHQMQVELKQLHAKIGLTTVFVTHDQGEALSLSDRVVVMSQGRIQQIAAPLDLYRYPANGFVASFIGEINRLPPAHWGHDGDRIIFDLPPGIRFVATPRVRPQFRATQRVCLFVRPEHITLADAAPGTPNRVAGRVVTHIYQGTHTLTRIDVEGLGNLDLRLIGGEIINQAPIGSTIEVALDLDEAVMLPEDQH